MGFRDRFYTPKTARALLSWRILLGVVVGVVAGLLGAPVALAGLAGLAAYGGSVLAALPSGPVRPSIDPFVLSEPWRQLMQSAQASQRKLRETVAGTDDGPLKATMQGVADQLEHGLAEAWAIARRGDEIDDAVRRLDPPALRSKLDTLRQRATAAPGPDSDAAIASVERQLESAARLKQQSDETASTLRLTQTQLDELVARASEVRVGMVETSSYSREVDDLVIKLEALRQAVQETSTS